MENYNNYFESLNEDRREALVSIHESILLSDKSLEVDMTYGMPSYAKNGKKIFAIASQKNYISFYVLPYDLIEEIRTEVSAIKSGKSCLRFKKIEEKDLVNIRSLIRYVLDNHSKSNFFEKY